MFTAEIYIFGNAALRTDKAHWNIAGLLSSTWCFASREITEDV
jgi:hypothetical protein